MLIIRALTTDVHVYFMSYTEFMMLYTYNGRAFTSWTHCKNTPSALHLPPCELLDTSWHTTVKLLSVEISSGFITYKQETVSKHSPIPRPSYRPVVDLYSQEGERLVHVFYCVMSTSRLTMTIYHCTIRLLAVLPVRLVWFTQIL